MGQGAIEIHVILTISHWAHKDRHRFYISGPQGACGWWKQKGGSHFHWWEAPSASCVKWCCIFFGSIHENNPCWGLSFLLPLSQRCYENDIIGLSGLGLVSSSVSTTTTTTTTKGPSVICSMRWHAHLGVIPSGGTSQRSWSHRRRFKYSCGRHAQRCEDYFLPRSEGRGSRKTSTEQRDPVSRRLPSLVLLRTQHRWEPET